MLACARASGFRRVLGFDMGGTSTDVSLINDGTQEMQSAPWMLLVPMVFLVTLLLCFNLVGDGLNEILNPRSDP